jgi:peptidoglycan/LPS O-acetylase OafA/YrhL
LDIRENTNTAKIEYLDSLRGIAILMVILVHTSQIVKDLPSSIRMFADYCQMGVQLFFVLSAFTLCLSMERRKNETNSIRNFYIRRFFRIAPLYYFAILFYLIYKTAMGFSTDYFTMENVLSNVFFIQGFYTASNNVVPGGWSIGTEMAFYLVFPLIFIFYVEYIKNRIQIILTPFAGLIICMVLTQSLFIASNYQLSEHGFLYLNLFNQLPVFLLGLSYYFFTKNLPANNKSWIICISLTGLILFSYLGINFYGYYFHITIRPFIAGLSFVFLIHILNTFKGMNITILKQVGQLSYSMYVFHFIFSWAISTSIANRLPHNIPPTLVLIICYTISVSAAAFVATISERVIERYGIKMGKKFIKRIASRNNSKILSIEQK